MNPAQIELRRWLRDQRRVWQPISGLCYRGPADFVIAHGEWFQPYACSPMLPKKCYANAIFTAERHGWTYVEGFAVAPTDLTLAIGGARYVGPRVVQHAWAEDPRGRMWELTWPVPGAAYRGVRFHHGRADDATWHGDATVLDDPNRNHPLLREAWTGEDWDREWEPSEVLAEMRRLLVERGETNDTGARRSAGKASA